LKGRSGWSAFLSSDGSLHRWAKSTEGRTVDEIVTVLLDHSNGISAISS